jgi:hypothetical protein
MKSYYLLAAALLSTFAAPAMGQDSTGAPAHAIGTDFSLSSDSEDTTVIRLGVNLDWKYTGPEDYVGIRLERNWYRIDDRSTRDDERVYVRAAGSVDTNWKYQLNIGTDFHTLLGSASVYDVSPWRKEFFIEREKVETAQGIRRPIISTFGGAALDIPVTSNLQFTALAGLQEFTGDNVRLHARLNTIFVVKPEWGLSLQLRARHWRNSDPDEFDYYSPKSYTQLLPVVQVRRFTDSGWRWLVVGGVGVERDSRSDWRQARFVNLRFSSPASNAGWSIAGDALYSNTPIARSEAYDYGRFSIGLNRSF